MDHSMVKRYISLPWTRWPEYQKQYNHCSVKFPINCFADAWLSWGEASWDVSPFPLGCGANILYFSPISLFPKSRGQYVDISPFCAKVPGDLTWSLQLLGSVVITGCKGTADKFLTARTALLTSSSALNSSCPELFIPLQSTVLFRGLSSARLDLSEGSPDVEAGSWCNCKICAGTKEVIRKQDNNVKLEFC